MIWQKSNIIIRGIVCWWFWRLLLFQAQVFWSCVIRGRINVQVWFWWAWWSVSRRRQRQWQWKWLGFDTGTARRRFWTSILFGLCRYSWSFCTNWKIKKIKNIMSIKPQRNCCFNSVISTRQYFKLDFIIQRYEFELCAKLSFYWNSNFKIPPLSSISSFVIVIHSPDTCIYFVIKKQII